MNVRRRQVLIEFNLCLEGDGIAVLESPVPRDELIEFILENDEVRIDGNFAIA